MGLAECCSRIEKKIRFRIGCLKRYFSGMRMLIYTVLVAMAMFTTACKDDAVEVQETPFSVVSADSVVFAHSGVQSLQVQVNSTAGKLLGARLEPIPSGFTVSDLELQIEANSSRDFSIQFNQLNASPGIYNTTLTTSIYNENSTPKSKQIYLVYRPECEYDFRNYTYGRLTYISSGNPVNKVLVCSYTTEGKLLVTGLTSYDVLLDVDCVTSAVSMQPVIHLSSYMTATGSVVNGEILLNIYSEGTLHATALIRAF
jgi:hypothetical protein